VFSVITRDCSINFSHLHASLTINRFIIVLMFSCILMIQETSDEMILQLVTDWKCFSFFIIAKLLTLAIKSKENGVPLSVLVFSRK
jgi:hypothetical protein